MFLLVTVHKGGANGGTRRFMQMLVENAPIGSGNISLMDDRGIQNSGSWDQCYTSNRWTNVSSSRSTYCAYGGHANAVQVCQTTHADDVANCESFCDSHSDCFAYDTPDGNSCNVYPRTDQSAGCSSGSNCSYCDQYGSNFVFYPGNGNGSPTYPLSRNNFESAPSSGGIGCFVKSAAVIDCARWVSDEGRGSFSWRFTPSCCNDGAVIGDLPTSSEYVLYIRLRDPDGWFTHVKLPSWSAVDGWTYELVSWQLVDNGISIEAVADCDPPTMTISSTTVNTGETSNDDSIVLTFESTEITSTFVYGDVDVDGGALSNWQALSGGTTYTATFTPSSIDGTKTINVAANKFTDSAGNSNSAATPFTYTYDTTGPTMIISSSNVSNNEVTGSKNVTLMFTSSEVTTDFSAEDVTVENGALSAFYGSGLSYVAIVSPVDLDSSSVVEVNVDEAMFTDASGNGNSIAPSIVWHYVPCTCGEDATCTIDSYTDVDNYVFTCRCSRVPLRFMSNGPVNCSSALDTCREIVDCALENMRFHDEPPTFHAISAEQMIGCVGTGNDKLCVDGSLSGCDTQYCCRGMSECDLIVDESSCTLSQKMWCAHRCDPTFNLCSAVDSYPSQRVSPSQYVVSGVFGD